MKILAVLLLLIPSTLGLIASLFIEISMGYPLTWWFYTIIFLFFWGGLIYGKPLMQKKNLLSVLTIIGLVLMVLYATPWNSRKLFLNDLDKIKPGMHEIEVRRIMNKYVLGTGWPNNPEVGSSAQNSELTIENALVFRHSNEGRFNSDWGIVSFEKNRVTKVSFSPD